MATLEEIIINNCSMPNIVCWAKRTICQHLRELHDSIVALQSLPPCSMKRLICSYLGDDIETMLEKVCALENELTNDDIQTAEFETFIIELLTDLTENVPFDEQPQTRNYAPAYFYPYYR